ncbi:MAG: S-adenosylmethionine:tRNA ribosyltransferase-isomerase [Acidobacteriaceae bacterium]
MRVSDFHFDLPEELIAQHPPAERGASRMLVLSREQGKDREQGSGDREQGKSRGQGTGDRGQANGVGLTDAMFRDLPEYLRAGDLLVLNDSRVLPARLFATRAGLGTQANLQPPTGLIEVLLVEEDREQRSGNRKQEAGNREQGTGLRWRALVKPARKVRVGETLEFLEATSGNTGILRSAQNDRLSSSEAALTAEVVGAGEFGERTLRFRPVEDFYGTLARIGHMPLPPYIRREQARETDSTEGFEAEDRERYQTVYAHELGSAAAPTAGLHFTPEMLAALAARGVDIAYVTLHVGLGTFQPVRVDRVEDIRLHSERYTLPAATADALNRALTEGRRVVAVGTTTTRTLEHIAQRAVEENEERVPGAKAPVPGEPVLPGLKSRPISEADFSAGSEVPRSFRFEAHSGSTSMFIGPGHRFRVVGGLLTNFHLPESTLLMLVSAFAAPLQGGAGQEHVARGRETVLAAYAHAVRERYRFYSYGDCMLVV